MGSGFPGSDSVYWWENRVRKHLIGLVINKACIMIKKSKLFQRTMLCKAAWSPSLRGRRRRPGGHGAHFEGLSSPRARRRRRRPRWGRIRRQGPCSTLSRDAMVSWKYDVNIKVIKESN